MISARKWKLRREGSKGKLLEATLAHVLIPSKVSSRGIVAEPPNVMPHRSARLPLDTKHSRENTRLLGSVGHTPGENPKIHIFAIRITNERIKLASFVTISYITFNTSEYNIY